MAFTIIYSPEAVDHLQELTKADQVRVIDQVVIHLTHNPKLASRKRKLLQPNQIASWELRLGDLRVFYDVDDPSETVYIMAVGVKRHNELWIGREKIIL